ncbi:S-layer homology domain-containing protein [Effusibacillus lacus]|uniref:S-layer homology domain-containing protein n=1 Tax=Effusibacillus lacus TaxID=1348429 RepID=A0A292YN72_9BACL|nr:S-layer homology domain-containing protein [Effusibacillus lacus]TCS70640.1 S-layer family protein [Effusibacillus lacus]GAX90636.1 S-layer homology domain-containing protein [Effusibacillus lacus]
MKRQFAILALTTVLGMGAAPAMAAPAQNSGNITIEGSGEAKQNIKIDNTTNVTNNVYRISFDDVKGHWAQDAIEKLAKKGILNGDEKGRFNPEQTVTREQFATMIAKMFQLEAETDTQDFEDVPPTRWSFKYVEASKDYMTSFRAPDGDMLFHPMMPAVRQDVVVSLVEILEAQDLIELMDADEAEELLKETFKDWERIAPALRPYVATAYQAGLVKGADGRFMPNDGLTRAQAAKLLVNVQEQMVVLPE